MKIVLGKKELTAKFCEFKNQIRRAPLLLRLFVIVSLITGILVPCQAIIPGIGANIYGTHLSWSQMWQTGNALILLAIGPIHLAVPYGVLRRERWIRPLLVCFPFFQILPFELVGFLFGEPGFLRFYDQKSAMLGFALFLAIYTIAVAAYLYRNQSVCSYFEQITEK